MSSIADDLTATVSYLLANFWCKVTDWFRPSPPPKPDYNPLYTSPDYTCKTDGECKEGTYCEVYQPQTPYLGDNNRPKVVIYLHGFDLGAAQIYGTHLEHLVKQGYYVIYPNFQTGFCSFPSKLWQTVAELAEEVVGDGIIDSQEKWLKNALASVNNAYETLGFTSDTLLDTYVFGHSLGGLFALSWPYYVKQWGYANTLLPQQVIVADPIPNTAIPGIPGELGKLINKVADDVDIKVTGQALTMPVAILHGNDDWVAPKAEWQEPFTYIATQHKTMFLSFTDQLGCPGLYANHEQATVDTSFFPVILSLSVLDGVGAENNLNWRYIWFALDQVIRFGARAD